MAVLGESLRDGRTVPGATFAPGTHGTATATVLTLAAGTDATADIQQETPEAVGSLVGQVLNGNSGASSVTVRLRRLNAGDETGTDLDEISAVTDDSGRFRFTELPVGAYKLRVVQFPSSGQPLLTLVGSFGGYAFGGGRRDNADVPLGGALPPLPTTPTLYAERDVLVDARSSDPILMRLQPGASISGRVVFQDGSAPAPGDLLRVPMLIRPADGSDWGGIPQGRIERDGSFRSPGLPPGDYVIVPQFSWARLSETWNHVALTSGGMDFLGGAITLNTTDVTDVLVTMSTKSAEVSGTVRRPSVSPTALSTRVIVFPKSERLRTFYYTWPSPKRVTQVSVTVSGAFAAVLPPGEYLAVAISDDLPEFWMTADYLARLAPSATPIRLGVGEKVTVSLEARAAALAR